MVAFEKIFDGLYLLKTPFSSVWTGIVLATGEKNFLIDSGAEEPEGYLLPALQKLGMKIEDIDYVMNTHCHGDHIAGHYTLAKRYGRKTAVYEGGRELLADPASNAIRIRRHFPEHSPAPQSWLKGVEADRVVKEGEIFENRFRVIASPGHEKDCVCWYDIPTGTIISGDSLQGNGTLTQGIGFYQSLKDYRATLEKLMALTDVRSASGGSADGKRADAGNKECAHKENEDKIWIRNLICGHEYDGIGAVARGCDEVKKALKRCMKYTEIYDSYIKAHKEAEGNDIVKLAQGLIREAGCAVPDKLFLALYTVEEHLNAL